MNSPDPAGARTDPAGARTTCGLSHFGNAISRPTPTLYANRPAKTGERAHLTSAGAYTALTGPGADVVRGNVDGYVRSGGVYEEVDAVVDRGKNGRDVVSARESIPIRKRPPGV